MDTTPQILAICTGNICRSPLIEGLLQRALDERWGSGAVLVGSAGTHGMTGSSMEPLAQERLEAMGGDATGFVARELTPDLVSDATLVITAAREHRAAAAQQHPSALRKAFTLLDLADLAEHLPDDVLPEPGTPADAWVAEVTASLAAHRGNRPPLPPEQADIPDPYGEPSLVYQQMADQAATALRPVIRVLTGR